MYVGASLRAGLGLVFPVPHRHASPLPKQPSLYTSFAAQCASSLQTWLYFVLSWIRSLNQTSISFLPYPNAPWTAIFACLPIPLPLPIFLRDHDVCRQTPFRPPLVPSRFPLPLLWLRICDDIPDGHHVCSAGVPIYRCLFKNINVEHARITSDLLVADAASSPTLAGRC
jgi:hypothetical protein